MRRKFIKVTSGWIPVSVLLLFAAAFVTGEPRGDRQGEIAVIDVPSAELHGEIRSTLRDVESVRYLVATITSVPARVERLVDAGIASGIKASGRPKLLGGFDHE